MSLTIKVIKIGDNAGIILPPKVLQKLGVQSGDEFTLRRLDSGYVMSTEKLAYEHGLTVANQVMDRNRGLLRKLAE